MPEHSRAARAAWPQITLQDEVFDAYVAEREAPASPERAADLFVACAASRGDGAAIAALEARYFGDLARALAKTGLDAADVAEVLQQLRAFLFVKTGDAPPRIVEYKGRGDLGGWLRVTAVRLGSKLRRKTKREVPLDDGGAAMLDGPGLDPEVGYLKEAYRAQFAEAFKEALRALPARERLLLQQHLLDGLSIDEIGGLHGVHRATAARWVSKAKDDLLADARERFAARVGVSKRECDSVLRMVESRLDVTLRSLAKPG